MTVSIKEHFKHHTAQESIELKRIMEAVQTDIAALTTSVTGITAQLDGDLGVTDVTYAANHDPAAAQLVS